MRANGTYFFCATAGIQFRFMNLCVYKTYASSKQVKRLIGFTKFFRNCLSELDENLVQFFRLLKKDAILETTEKRVKALEVIKKDLTETTNAALRLQNRVNGMYFFVMIVIAMQVFHLW